MKVPFSLAFSRRKYILIFVVFLICILGVVLGRWAWQKYTTPPTERQQALAAKEVIDAVGKLIELPSDEVPTVATVSEESKLLDQPFFAQAQTGDKVLFYPNNRRAILYRPSTNKLIEVSSLLVTSPTE